MTEVIAGPAAVSLARSSILQRLLVVVTLAVSLLFLYSGVEKWSDIGQFERIIVSHGLVGQAWAGRAGAMLACIELGGGALGLSLVLLAGLRLLAPILLAQAGLFLGLSVYAGVLVAQPPPEPTSCGCGMFTGPVGDWSGILTRNAITAAALGLAAMLAIWSTRRPDAHVGGSDRSLKVAAR